MNAYEKEYDERDFEDMLNENYEEVNVLGITYGAGTVLKAVDPIAFRCAMSDEPVVWVCDECGEEYSDEDEAEECCKWEVEDEEDD